MMQAIRAMFTPQQRRIVAAEAKQALQDKHWNAAIEAVEGYLIESAKGCNPDDKDKCQRITISMQLLEAIKREIVRKIEDGEMATIEMNELDKRKRLVRFER